MVGADHTPRTIPALYDIVRHKGDTLAKVMGSFPSWNVPILECFVNADGFGPVDTRFR